MEYKAVTIFEIIVPWNLSADSYTFFKLRTALKYYFSCF